MTIIPISPVTTQTAKSRSTKAPQASIGGRLFHTRAVLDRKPWIGEFDPLSGIILHEQAEFLPEAAE